MKKFPGQSRQERWQEMVWESGEVKKWKTRLIPLEGRQSQLRELASLAKRNEDYIAVIRRIMQDSPWLIEDLVFLKTGKEAILK